MDQAAADGAAVANCRMGNLLDRFAKNRQTLVDRWRALDIPLPHHRAEREDAIVEPDLVQAFDAVEIDQVMRLRQTEIHQRHETLPAGEDFGFISMRSKKRQCFVDVSWPE